MNYELKQKYETTDKNILLFYDLMINNILYIMMEIMCLSITNTRSPMNFVSIFIFII